MAALEALSSNDFFNFIIYDTISATPYTTTQQQSTSASFSLFENNNSSSSKPVMTQQQQQQRSSAVNLAPQGIRKKRRRKPRVCKNKEEAETQRMTHIAVERNRRKQMNEHLAILRTLMPESYVQRGDQASIVGGAIDYVKELEHLLQSLEAQKLQLVQNGVMSQDKSIISRSATPFSEFFVFPQYTWSQLPNKFTSKNKQAAIADIEVTLIETHANIRILSPKSPRQLSKLVSGFQSLHLSVLHLNVTTLHPLVLYSISAKIEEGCQVRTVDDIAGAVHHMLRIIEEPSNVDHSTTGSGLLY
ncbi:hypothetical protein LWI29_006864 [Acer saccharum]|uniref:BHLH domain-containing protein n=1 Tax=Acer saccharum TaxID=4024 RepID=A0AA39SBZ2_ACESA|nr:hypothetical protein LWI29_006864 [Acer saccharum]KAK1567238.1 hypothetical protein Q3G72_009731 [Acer saccharum]